MLLFLLPIFLTAYSTTPSFLEENDSSWAQETLQSLTLRQKIGQLLVVAAASCFEQPTEILATAMFHSPYAMDEPSVTSFIKEYQVGGVIFLYKSSPAQQLRLTQQFQNLASVPLLIVQDCEWGLSMRLDKEVGKVVHYPRNGVLGTINDEMLTYRLGKEIGNQCRALGIHLNCAPVIDINNNPGNKVIGDRSFGDDPELVARLGAAYASGLQDAGILSCAKHFPGHGDTHVDSHHALPTIAHTRERLEAIELYPFKQLIARGVDAIMMAHLVIPALDATVNQPASMSYAIATQELQERLAFQGLVITDGLGMRAITNHYKPGDLELQAFLAGNDILLCPVDVTHAIDKIEQAIMMGLVSEAELDRRVLKILRAKEWVLRKQIEYTITQDPLDYIVRPEAYALQKELYARAGTTIKNPF